MRAALAFLTPLGGAAEPRPSAVRWFPVVGLLVGLGVGGAWRGASELWTPAVAAAIAVVVDLLLTGMLHVDGLTDSADGLLPHLERERRLAVMAEPTVGAFGVVVVAATLLLRWAALASLTPDVWLVVGLWILSRTVMAYVLTSVPYARDGGLATAFRGEPGRLVAAAGLLVAALVLVAAHGPPGLAVLAGGALAGSGVVLLAVRRLGGYTGDVLGAAGVLCETVGLVVAAARW